jgi:hypothetical protein
LTDGHIAPPASGSDTPMQPTHVAGDRRHAETAVRSSSLPKRASAGVHMSVCTPMAMGTPPQSDAAQRLGHQPPSS